MNNIEKSIKDIIYISQKGTDEEKIKAKLQLNLMIEKLKNYEKIKGVKELQNTLIELNNKICV